MKEGRGGERERTPPEKNDSIFFLLNISEIITRSD